RLTDGIGPLKATYGIWQKPQASFRKGDISKSKFNSLPSISTASYPLPRNVGWITCQSRTRQLPPFIERFIEDESDFALNPGNLRVQVGRQNAGRIGVIRRDWALKRVGGKRSVRNTRDPKDRC